MQYIYNAIFISLLLCLAVQAMDEGPRASSKLIPKDQLETGKLKVLNTMLYTA